jgi:hypothetical protein
MIDTQQQYIKLNIHGEINNCGTGTLGQEKRYMHINVHTLMKWWNDARNEMMFETEYDDLQYTGL